MGGLLENARKQTLHNYRAILQDIHEKPSIIAQTYKNPQDGRPVVSLRPLYLCLQCPNIMTAADRDEHIDVKRHIFCRSTKGREELGADRSSRGVPRWERLLW